MISFFRLSISILSNFLKLLGASAKILKSGAGPLLVGSGNLVGEDDRSAWTGFIYL